MFCSKCGKEISNQVSFCKHCGTKVETEERIQSDLKEPSFVKADLVKKKKKQIVVSLVALVLALILVAIFVFVPRGYQIEKDVVIDHGHDLMWQRGLSAIDGKKGQINAIEYCEELSLAGYDDWRLPNISELKTLVKGCQSGSDICKVNEECLSFADCWSKESCSCKKKLGPGEDGYYWPKEVWEERGEMLWSSSLNSPNTAWFIDFSYARLDAWSITNDSFDIKTKCVRTLSSN